MFRPESFPAYFVVRSNKFQSDHDKISLLDLNSQSLNTFLPHDEQFGRKKPNLITRTNDSMTPISFVTVIKNRVNLRVVYNKTELILKLFENNIKSLISLIQPSDEWEFIIVDFESKDCNMTEWVNALPRKSNLEFVVKTVKTAGRFDKGRGLNYGASLTTKPLIFFLDADMMIKTRTLFDDIEKIVAKEGKVLFPKFWKARNPEHTSGGRTPGTGNVIQRKETVIPYVNNHGWGHEDSKNFQFYERQNMSVIVYYGKGFIHQWHPKHGW